MSSTLPSVSIIIILACVPGRQVNNEILISSPFKRGLTQMGGLFNLEITMVSVLHKELEYKDIVEKLKYKKF